MEVHARVAQWRRAAGLTQRELAERAGMSVGAIRDIEQGRTTNPLPSTIRRLADVLGVGQDFRLQVLGPLTAQIAGAEIDLGPPRQRAVLALLALHPNETVARDAIIDALWPETTDAINTLQTYIARLRRILEPGRQPGDRGGMLASAPNGYRLRVSTEDLDLLAFRDLLVRARAEPGLYQGAGQLCHGLPLADVPELQAHPALIGVRDEWLAAVVADADTALDDHQPGRVLAVLRQAANAEPLHGAVHARLIRGLVATGERARALRVFDRFRRRLRDELGVGPDPEVMAAYETALHSDAAHQLPADIPEFTGRAAQLRLILDWARTDRDAVTVITIAGMGGIGKTRLALHAAHRLRTADIELFADLQGFSADHAPVAPATVLDDFLRQLGVPTGDIPGSLAGRSALLRDRLHDRPALLVLDNASNAEQVLPLIPGSRAVVLVTSRRNLALDGARSLQLDVFEPDEAVAAMRQIVGATRIDNEPDATERVLTLCGRVPLAVALAARRLAVRPQWTMDDLADRLAAADRRLAGLSFGTRGLRGTFQLSYDGLETGQRLLFGRLGLHPGADFTAESAAALMRGSAGGVVVMLDDLVDEHLAQAEPGRRYRLHDLLREYAIEVAETDSGGERAVRDVLRWYLATAAGAAGILNPARRAIEVDSPDHPAPLEFDSYESALAWMEAERNNLVAAVRLAADLQLHDLAWRLALALWDLFQLRRYWDDWIATHEIGVASARALGNEEAEALLLTKLANAYHGPEQVQRSIACLHTALSIFERTGDLTGDAGACTNLGLAYMRTEGPAAAEPWLHRAVAKSREFGVPINIANAVANLGWLYNEWGKLDRALPYSEEAVAIAHDCDHKYVYGASLAVLGEVYWKLGRLDDALDTNQQALDINRAAGARIGEADALTTLGDIYDSLGRPADARRCWFEALPLLEEINDPRLDRVRENLST